MPGRGDRGGKKEKPKDAKGTLLRILTYLRKYSLWVFLLLLLTIASNVGNLLGPSYAGKAITAASAGKGLVDMKKVLHYAGLMLAAYVGSNLLNIAATVGMMRVGKKVAANMRQDVFEKLMRLPVGYFDRHQAGDIISRVSYDIDVVSTSLASDVVQILTGLVTVIGSFVMMCVISLPLVACMLFTIPASLIFTAKMSRLTRPRYSKRSASYGAMNDFVEEMFTGQKTILSYANEDRVCERFRAVNGDAAEAYMHADGLGMIIGPTIGFISNLGLASIGLGGSLLFLAGSVSLGQISSFILYSRKFSGPINEIANIANEILSALAAAERVFALLDEPEEVSDRPEAGELKRAEGEVELKKVSFGYLPGKTILHGLNLRAGKGQTIAIVGPTGAGKTTIINLLMRFYEAGSGEILVDGREVHSYTLSSLRKNYAMVLQDTWVFHGSIFENIAYGKENATLPEVVRAAKAARIHNDIMKLPEGYNTVISDDAGNISKGQLQLLTIARAMLFDTRMLILDEATSNVDTATEREVQKAMRELMKGRTCFVIAHRLSTIQNADRILVLEQGDVREQGTHEELMERKGTYYRLYMSQYE